MIGHSALPRSGFFVSVRRLRRLLAAAIFLHAACRHTSLVLAACCSIAERLVSYFRRSIAAARVSRVLSADSARKWTCRRLFCCLLRAATLHFCELSSASKTENFRLFRGTCAYSSSLHGVLCARSHLDLWPSCCSAKCYRRSVTWAVQLKNRGRPRCCTAQSSKKKGELLASLVSMALIRDLRNQPFRWAFYEASLSSAVLVSPEARIRCSLPNLARMVRGSMGQTVICGNGLCDLR